MITYSASFALQDQALGDFVGLARNELLAYQAGVQSIVPQISGTACDGTTTRDAIASFIVDVRTNGLQAFPPEELDLFNVFGVDPTPYIPTIAGFDPSQAPLSMSEALGNSAQAVGQFFR